MKTFVKVIFLFLVIFIHGHSAQNVNPSSKVQALLQTDGFAFDNLPYSPNAIVGGYRYLITNNVLPSSISFHQPTGCFFLAIPRKAPGIPATVTYVNSNNYPNSNGPPLTGFPTYQDNFLPGWFGVSHYIKDNCNIYPGDSQNTWPTRKTSLGSYRDVYHFTSVVYTYLDKKCSRLFFIDSGILEYNGRQNTIREPVLWAFNINGCDASSFDLALKVTIPRNMVKYPTGFARFDIDVYGSCFEFAVYITNHYDNKLIVYDNVQRKFWYFYHETFNPLADRANIPIYPQIPDPSNHGICGIALGRQTAGNIREVFYAPGSSYSLYRTSSSILRNQAIAPGSPSSPNFSYIGYRGTNAGVVMQYDEVTQVLFFVHLLTNSVSCWNTNKTLQPTNVATLFNDLLYGVDLLIDPDRNLWFMLRATNVNPISHRSEVNRYFYQTYRANIDELISGTVCDPKV